jgi:hypothetical protein
MTDVDDPGRFVSFGGRQIPLDELLVAWRDRVAAIARQASHDPSAPDLTVHDMIGAYHLRNALEGANVGAWANSDIAAADAELRDITEVDPYGYGIRIADDDNPTTPWWWMRIPRSGQIRDEIEQLRHNRGLDR